MPPSSLELKFDTLWNQLHPDLDLETEVKLISDRKFRFDYVHSKSKIAIEVNGGIWTFSGHSSGKGLLRDYEKLNLAQSLGYHVFFLSGEMIDAHWLNLIASSIKVRTDEVKMRSK